MKYWFDLNSSTGFNEGTAIPDGIAEYRQVYLEVINTLIKNNSPIRLIAINDPDFSNKYLILPIPEETYDNLLTEFGEYIFTGEDEVYEAIDWKGESKIKPKRYSSIAEPWPGISTDENYFKTIIEANALDLDSLVNIRVRLNRSKLEDLIARIEMPDVPAN